MRRSCERLWEVDALREGRLAPRDVASFARHRRSCEACRIRFEEDERLVTLGRALPSPEVDPFHARRLRKSILRAAGTHGEPRRLRSSPATALSALGICVVVGLLMVWSGHGSKLFSSRAQSATNVQSATNAQSATNVQSATNAMTAPSPVASTEKPFGALVDAEPGALWEARSEGLVERVKLTAGAITLTVRHRESGERFVVDLPDGEIEVRGTRFRVEVFAASTRAVQVYDGLVALRRRDAREVSIAAGESWPRNEARHDPEPTADAASTTVARLPASSHSAKGGGSARPAANALAERRDDAEDDSEYEAAVSLFTAHRYDEAARALHAFAAAHSDRALAEDAAFLEASALARGGRADAASLVAERFLDRYPASIHAPDAASLVVRAARERQDCARARSVAAKWIAEPIARAAALGRCADAGGD